MNLRKSYSAFIAIGLIIVIVETAILLGLLWVIVFKLVPWLGKIIEIL